MGPATDARVDDLETLISEVRHGDVAAVARMLTLVEQRSPVLPRALAELHQSGHHAHVIGVTGPPGAGKSTLVSRLAATYSHDGRSVGIIAVDPSSAFSGGAILGDRIRMDELSGDARIFIRSMATRGALGGLARATLDAVTVLDAAGNDIILLETVGVGQAEVDIVSVAHTIAVVSVPGLGDDVQMIKAGLLEIADVHVVNKSDSPGADRVFAQIRELQRLSKSQIGAWKIPVQRTVALTGEGICELVKVFDEHWACMSQDRELEQRERRTASTRIRWAAEDLIRSYLTDSNNEFMQAVEEVTARSDDPYSAAHRLLRSANLDSSRGWSAQENGI